MARIKRELLLAQLESVQPGLSTREVIEQSSCFAFHDGKVSTYNDDVSCTWDSAIPDVTGAVKAEVLLKLLRAMPDEEIDVESNGDELLITGMRAKRSAGIRLESEVLLPLDAVEPPTKWHKLPLDFLDAINMVQSCASKDESDFKMTCVHIHPNHVEACDAYQLARYEVETNVTESTLVRREAIRHIVALGCTRVSQTDNWLHFKNKGQLVLSCRRYVQDYENLDEFLNTKKGYKTVLPKGIVDETEMAELFSSDAEENQVIVQIRPGFIRVKGIGDIGWFKSRCKMKYAGKPLTFTIAPMLLQELVRQHNECEINQDTLRVNGGKFVYVACLGEIKVPDKEMATAAAQQEE